MIKSSESFARSKRVLKPIEFKYIFSKAIRYANNSFIILARTNQLGQPRLGLAISKKSIKLSVHRNRIKRLTRETFRKNNLIKSCCFDFVVMAKKNISHQSNQVIEKALINAFEQIIIKNPC